MTREYQDVEQALVSLAAPIPVSHLSGRMLNCDDSGLTTVGTHFPLNERADMSDCFSAARLATRKSATARQFQFAGWRSCLSSQPGE